MESDKNWPKETSTAEKSLEETLEDNIILHVCEETHALAELANRVSSWKKMVRVVAWMKRFAANCKKSAAKVKGEINAEEFQAAELIWSGPE
jgi:hypothetical protein